ncbi:MAG: DUF924 domain-containing protein [Devosia sp.]|nr:DUF924 domain-containing protein [Devosia sp.]
MPAAEVLDFWFGTCSPEDWWRSSPELDRIIAERFGETHRRLALGEGFSWRASPEGRLAEIIVLDQFSRQLYRGDPRAFAQDGMALALAQEAVAVGCDRAVPEDRRLFLYMPFMHSESLLVHEAALPLFVALGGDNALKSANEHLEVLRRFGRYPKRNAALGRVSTPEELAYLAEIGDRMF